MLVFNEGVPGAGKSYDAVKAHIIPALKKRRKVFARLNGAENPDCRTAMAKLVGMTPDELDEFYIHVPSSDVVAMFQAVQEGDEWQLPEEFRNALVVIDEVHQFYIGGTREQLPRAVEEFFAMARHKGCDIVLLTQFYKRIHTALRYRIERKTTFQKLSVLGKLGESKYLATAYQTLGPDKYEKVGSETQTYDPQVFAAYRGITDAEVQTEVYSGGRKSVWKPIIMAACVMVPLLIFAVGFIVYFFSGGAEKSFVGASKPKQTATYTVAANGTASTDGVAYNPATFRAQAVPSVPAVTPGQVMPPPDPLAKLSPMQRYVWELAGKGRARLAAVVGEGATAKGLVEWVKSDTGVVEDRLTFAQLRALGVTVKLEAFGVVLAAEDQIAIVTAWPLNRPLRDEQPRLYDTSGGLDDSGPGASEASPGLLSSDSDVPGIETAPSAAPQYGAFRG